jgi:hypothetical protein
VATKFQAVFSPSLASEIAAGYFLIWGNNPSLCRMAADSPVQLEDAVSLKNGKESAHQQMLDVCKRALPGWGQLTVADVQVRSQPSLSSTRPACPADRSNNHTSLCFDSPALHSSPP